MTLTFAWLGLLSILVLLDMVLTLGLLRAVRNRQTLLDPATRIVRPTPGTAIKLSPAWQWSDGATSLPSGNVMLALVVPGCLGCQVLRREFETLPLPTETPLYVAADTDVTGFDIEDYLASSWSIADAVTIAPEPLEAMPSIGNPDELPVIAFLRDGVVVASAHRLEHLMRMLQPTDWASTSDRRANS